MLNVKNFSLKSEYRSDSNHAWYILGDIYFKRNRFEKAAAAFRNSIRLRPNDPEALWALGNSYSELGKPILAERCFRRALKHSTKKKAEIRFNLGNALFDQRRYASAIDTYKLIRPTSKSIFRLARKNTSRARKKLEHR
jgi:tetratricopeptide (TPR) repeat protein